MAFAFSNTTTQVTDQSRTDSRAGTIGDLSSQNKLVTGDYYEQGLVGDNLFSVIDSIKTAAVNNFDKTASLVQSSTQQAIEEVGKAYAESKSEARNILEGLKPIALYAALGAALYFAVKKG